VKLVESGEVDSALEDMRVVVNKFESACGEERMVEDERMSMELDREEDAMDVDTDREKRKRDKEEDAVENVPDKKQKLSNDDEGEYEKEAYMHIPKYLPSVKLFEHEVSWYVENYEKYCSYSNVCILCGDLDERSRISKIYSSTISYYLTIHPWLLILGTQIPRRSKSPDPSSYDSAFYALNFTQTGGKHSRTMDKHYSPTGKYSSSW